jgi:RND family efflux transporter MFP subunit
MMNYESPVIAGDGAGGYAQQDAAPAPGRRRVWLIIGLVALLAAATLGYFLVAGSGGADDAAAAGDDKASQAQTVTVAAPGSQSVTHAITATGTLGARRDVAVGVVGEGGMVARVLVEAGDWVRPGQTLASIERSVQVQQIAGLEAQIGVARADLNLAEAELQRARALIDRGFISKADVDRKTATRDGAAARLRAAQAAVAEARARTARLDVRAPVGGFILERRVEPGQVVGAGSGTLFRIAMNGEMEMQARVDEAALGAMSVGIPAEVRPVGTQASFTGRVWQLAPTIDAQTRQGVARIALPFDPALRPGGFASATISAGSASAPVLPESAIQSDEKGSFVYIVGADNKVARRDVTTGTVTAAGIAVTAGLAGTERVVLTAGGFLNPGETVRPRAAPQAR